MTKKIYLQNTEISDYIKDCFKNKDVEIIVCQDKEILRSAQNNEFIIRIHPSLLPAFDCENPIEQAFLSGVKVSGITILVNNKITAQYPVLIGLETHLDEFKQEIINLEKQLVPAVIEAVIEDRVFDFSDLMRKPCSHSGGCSGCRGCK